MNAASAREHLSDLEGKTPCEIGEAVDVLYPEYGSYVTIAQQFGKSATFWHTRHRLFQLPEGIRWKIDEKQIGIDQGYQISRLTNDEDQWVLALAIIEEEDLTAKECQNVVNLVLNQEKSVRDALSVSAGIRFDKIPLLLPLGFDIRLSICKVAWKQCQSWENLCYHLILQGIDVDIREVARQLEELAADLRKAGGEEK